MKLQGVNGKRAQGLLVAAATAALTFVPSATRAAPSTWTGAASNAWENAGNWSAGSPGSTSVTNSTDVATFNANPGANLNPTPDLNRNIAGITFDTSSIGAYTIGSTGGNALILSNAGTIQLTSTAGISQVVNAPLTLAGNYTFSNANTTAGRTLTFGGAITGSSASAQTLTLTGASANNNTIGGNITDGSGGGTVAISKAAAGTWVLNGTNSYSGTTTVTTGNLLFGSSAAIGGSGASVTIAAAGAAGGTSAGSLTPDVMLTRIATGSGGALTIASPSALNLDFSSYANLSLGATTSTTYSGTMTPNGNNYRFGGGGATLTVSSKLTGAGNNLVIGNASSSGNVTLSDNTNDFGGSITINAGNLNVSNPGQLGGGNSITVAASGAALQLTAAGTYGSSKSINITGNGVNSVGALTSSTGTNAIWAGGVALGADQARIGGSVAGSFLDIQGVISGSGRAPVVRGTNNTSVVQFSNANTYTGNNTGIVVGTLKLNNAAALPSTTGVAFGNNSSTGTGVVLNLNGFGTQLLGVQTVAGNNIAADINSATSALLTLGNSTPTNYTYGSTVSSTTHGTVSGAIALLKTGTNTQTLAGLANNYSGGTTITGGTLALSATATTGTGNVTVTPTATANVSLDLTNATPGASGTISDTATVTLSSSGAFYGRVVFGSSTLNETISTLIVDGETKPAGTYDSTNLPNFISGNGSLTVTAPEPATAGMLAIAGIGLLSRRRRNRQSR